MLSTILRNLVGNAIKFSEFGSRVSVSCRTAARHVTIDIEDKGRGIAEFDTSRIFEAFQRGETTDRTGGLGLGLHIVRETANILRHPVTVSSLKGRGSTFSITVPRAIV